METSGIKNVMGQDEGIKPQITLKVEKKHATPVIYSEIFILVFQF